MSQCDYYQNAFKDKKQPFLVEIQNSSFSGLKTATVIPLIPDSILQDDQKDDVFMPLITIADVDYRLFTSMMTTVRRERLVKHCGNLSTYRDQIIRAIEYYISWN